MKLQDKLNRLDWVTAIFAACVVNCENIFIRDIVMYAMVTSKAVPAAWSCNPQNFFYLLLNFCRGPAGKKILVVNISNKHNLSP